jgi:hypothetical protein
MSHTITVRSARGIKHKARRERGRCHETWECTRQCGLHGKQKEKRARSAGIVPHTTSFLAQTATTTSTLLPPTHQKNSLSRQTWVERTGTGPGEVVQWLRAHHCAHPSFLPSPSPCPCARQPPHPTRQGTHRRDTSAESTNPMIHAIQNCMQVRVGGSEGKTATAEPFPEGAQSVGCMVGERWFCLCRLFRLNSP